MALDSSSFAPGLKDDNKAFDKTVIGKTTSTHVEAFYIPHNPKVKIKQRLILAGTQVKDKTVIGITITPNVETFHTLHGSKVKVMHCLASAGTQIYDKTVTCITVAPNGETFHTPPRPQGEDQTPPCPSRHADL